MKFTPSPLSGTVTLPESKSLWHRELIAGSLSGTSPVPVHPCGDVAATDAALRALKENAPRLHCRQSGATLRFLLPLAAALGKTDTEFLCGESLLRRPLPLPFPVERTERGYRLTGTLPCGTYSVDASATSQVISGLFMALPLLRGDSDIMLTSPPVSRGYITMTLTVLRRHGITIEETLHGWHVPGGQAYRSAPPLIEGDWSAGSWYALFCPDVTMQNAPIPSCQPDSVVLRYVNHMPDVVDISATPDLLPPLALYAALQPGMVTRFTGGAFLRGKESDRLHTVAAALNALGGRAAEQADGLTVTGGDTLRGGSVKSCGDHRIALLGAFAAQFCQFPVFVDDTRCIEKSYPQFLLDFCRLGGKVEE